MLACSVWRGRSAGLSLMGYYEILMESLEYLAKSGNVFSDFSRTDDHFLHGRDSVCKKAKK